MRAHHRRLIANPVLALPAAKALLALPDEPRLILAALLDDLARDARSRAEASWKSHKAPMAAYWKAVSVYAGHVRKALLRGGSAPARPKPELRLVQGASGRRRLARSR